MAHTPNETREQRAMRFIRESGKAIHASDCATSCAPAEEPGPCDCDVQQPSPTPLPWEAVFNDSFWEIDAAFWSGKPITKYSPSVAYVWNVGADTAAANARLIVRAVNAFEPMRKAIKAFLESDSANPYDVVEHSEHGDAINAAGRARGMMRAALALADKEAE